MRSRLLIIFLALGLLAAACSDPGVVGSENVDLDEASVSEEPSTSVVPKNDSDSDDDDGTEDVDGNEHEAVAPEAVGEHGEESTKTPDGSETDDDSTSTTRPTKEPERVPEPVTSPPVTGETPVDLLAQIIADAADRAGVADSAVTVIRDEFAIWNDGSLGCPEPGQLYTQATVDGYWVVLQAAGVEYDYRANTTGYWFLCEGAGFPVQAPSG